jgi:hypothetical protein
LSELEKQVLNRFETGFEIEVARRIEAMAKQWADEKPRPVQLLRALCQWVTSSSQDFPRGATSDDLVAVIQGSDISWHLSGDSAKTISKYWKVLEGIWEKRKKGVCERLADEPALLARALDQPHGRWFLPVVWHPPV